MYDIIDKITLPRDKANHAFYGLLLYDLFTRVSNDYIAIYLVIAIAILKEVVYMVFKDSNFDIEDIAYTIFIPCVIFVIDNLII